MDARPDHSPSRSRHSNRRRASPWRGPVSRRLLPGYRRDRAHRAASPVLRVRPENDALIGVEQARCKSLRPGWTACARAARRAPPPLPRARPVQRPGTLVEQHFCRPHRGNPVQRVDRTHANAVYGSLSADRRWPKISSIAALSCSIPAEKYRPSCHPSKGQERPRARDREVRQRPARRHTRSNLALSAGNNFSTASLAPPIAATTAARSAKWPASRRA